MKGQHKRADRKAGPRTIGKLAKEAGVNVETIRFYERRGLLRQPRLPTSGWRVYDDSAVWVIHYIKLGRQLGFSLGEPENVAGERGWRSIFLRVGAKGVRGQDWTARQEDRAIEGHAQWVEKGSGSLREEKRHGRVSDRAKVQRTLCAAGRTETYEEVRDETHDCGQPGSL